MRDDAIELKSTKSLFDLIEQGELNALENALEFSNPDLEAFNKDGYTPLNLAVKLNSPQMVALLIHYGAKVDALNMFGETALHIASRSNHDEIVELLVKSKANVKAQDQHGATPLFYAYKRDDMTSLEKMFRGLSINDLNQVGVGHKGTLLFSRPSAYYLTLESVNAKTSTSTYRR